MARNKSIKQVFTNALSKARRATSGRGRRSEASATSTDARRSRSPLASVKKSIAESTGSRSTTRSGRASSTSRSSRSAAAARGGRASHGAGRSRTRRAA